MLMYAERVSYHKQVHPVLNMMFVWGPLQKAGVIAPKICVIVPKTAAKGRGHAIGHSFPLLAVDAVLNSF